MLISGPWEIAVAQTFQKSFQVNPLLNLLNLSFKKISTNIWWQGEIISRLYFLFTLSFWLMNILNARGRQTLEDHPIKDCTS